uniref:UDP-glucuronosyltransferase n=1 Tax=Stomoxys calcitrans TaxID=35570 RepID=A0A1I8Q3X2_STOCA
MVLAYKYLAVLPTASKSHFIVGSALMKALAQKGHEVYVISPFLQDPPIDNYHDMPIPRVLNAAAATLRNFFELNERSWYGRIFTRFDLGIQLTEVALKEPKVQQLLNSNQTFDAVICEVSLSEALFGLSEHFKAPLIGLGTFGAISWNTDMVGSPSPPSYVPLLMIRLTDRMTLMERVQNLAFLTLEKMIMEWYYLPRQAAIYRKYFPHLPRDMYEVRKNAALVLLNTHVSLAYPRPYVPNQIEVGGMHINRHRKPLPEKIEKFINDSKHGVIYFSMGSNLKSKDIPVEKKNEILKAFKNLKQRVLWKFEDKELKDKPENVLISDWFPQDDILAHKNVQVFITHGGLLSTMESIYHGVPLVGIPIYGDQFNNMAAVENKGYGLTLDYRTLSAKSLSKALERVMHDKRFKQNIMTTSQRYRDQDMLPLDKAIYWVEHVVRQNGAQYLHCAGLDLNFIQYHNLDAMLILYGVTILVIFSVLYSMKLLIKGLVKTLKPNQKMVKKN